MPTLIEGDVFTPVWPGAVPAKTDPARGRYAWADICDGQTHILWSETDFHVDLADLRSALNHYSARHDLHTRSKSYRFIATSGEVRECLVIHSVPAGTVGWFTFDPNTGSITYEGAAA